MSYYGGASSMGGGGGSRFSAPSERFSHSTGIDSASSSSSLPPLSTAPGAPSLPLQVLQHTRHPLLETVWSMVESCRQSATTLVRGGAAQQQFNAQFSDLVGALSSVRGEVEGALFAAAQKAHQEGQRDLSTADSAAAPSSSTAAFDIQKVPQQVSLHDLVQSVSAHVASGKGSVSLPYLNMVSKSVTAALVAQSESASAHSATKAGTTGPGALRGRQAVNAAAAAAANPNNTMTSASAVAAPKRQSGVKAGRSDGDASAASQGGKKGGARAERHSGLISPVLMPMPVVLDGLPSPLLRAALNNSSNNNTALPFLSLDPSQPGGSSALLPPPALFLPAAGGGSGGSGPSSGNHNAQVPSAMDRTALQHILQPWLQPYPFSYGVQPERVQTRRRDQHRKLKESLVVASLSERDPKRFAVLQARAQAMMPASAAKEPPQQPHHHHPHPSAGSNQQQQGHGHHHHHHHHHHPPQQPGSSALNDLIIAGMRQTMRRDELYAVAPKGLGICACPTASAMMRLWEERDAVFELLLNGPPGGETFSSSNATAAQQSLRGERGGSGSEQMAPPARTGSRKGDQDLSELYSGSPTLRPLHSPRQPTMGAMPGGGGDSPLPPLSLNSTGADAALLGGSVPRAKIFPHRVWPPAGGFVGGGGGSGSLLPAPNPAAISPLGVAQSPSPRHTANAGASTPKSSPMPEGAGITPLSGVPGIRTRCEAPPTLFNATATGVSAGGGGGGANPYASAAAARALGGKDAAAVYCAPLHAMSISPRVMTCMQHFGVALTDQPRFAREANTVRSNTKGKNNASSKQMQ